VDTGRGCGTLLRRRDHKLEVVAATRRDEPKAGGRLASPEGFGRMRGKDGERAIRRGCREGVKRQMVPCSNPGEVEPVDTLVAHGVAMACAAELPETTTGASQRSGVA
jgi:hypothetical protein